MNFIVKDDYIKFILHEDDLLPNTAVQPPRIPFSEVFFVNYVKDFNVKLCVLRFCLELLLNNKNKHDYRKGTKLIILYLRWGVSCEVEKR